MGEARRSEAPVGALLGLAAAAPALVYLRGFTIDDALIPARYATHLAHGLGYRFNPKGPSTDGVTPLGWPLVLAPFASGGPLAALSAARAIGMAAWAIAASALGWAIGWAPGSRLRYVALLLVVVSAPLAAWAAAGLETGVVIALATAAAVVPAQARWSSVGAALAGACAWLRPEMLPFAAVLGAGRAAIADLRRQKATALALAIGPWVAQAAIRWAVWGRPAPLAVLAKPSDLVHGLGYVLPAVVFTGAPVAACAPLGWRALGPWPRWLLVGGISHLAAVALAGGDWMPLARLITPVLPAFVLVTAHLLGAAARPAIFAGARLIVGCAAQIYVFATRGPVASRVLADRLALIESARDHLRSATRIATIDVGWVGAAAGSDAAILDLAGATDPEVAALPGGHTSKAVSGAFLTGHGVDVMVLELAADADPSAPVVRCARLSESRLAEDPLVHRAYRPVWESPATLPIRYVIFRATE